MRARFNAWISRLLLKGVQLVPMICVVSAILMLLQPLVAAGTIGWQCYHLWRDGELFLTVFGFFCLMMIPCGLLPFLALLFINKRCWYFMQYLEFQGFLRRTYQQGAE